MVDETTEVKQDEQTSADEGGTTPEETLTLTESQAQAREAKARSDALAELGRIKKAADDANKAAADAVRRLQEREDAEMAKAEEAAKDDPDALSRIRRERQTKEREAKLAERETKIQTQYARVIQTTAKALEGQYNVSAETLLKFAPQDADAMEELAKSYGERKEEGEPETKPTKRMTQEPDSGKTKGGGAGLTIADVAKMSPTERHERAKEIAAIPFS